MLENLLYSKDEVTTYKEIQKLEKDSIETNKLYKNMNLFFKLLSCDKSYVRSRGLKLISLNSKWDEKKIINANINTVFPLLNDKKAIVSRECVKALKNIMINKPELNNIIINKLNNTDLSMYNDSMSELIQREIDEIIKND